MIKHTDAEVGSREAECSSVMKMMIFFYGHLSHIEEKATKTKSSYFPVIFIRFAILYFFSEVCNLCHKLVFHNT